MMVRKFEGIDVCDPCRVATLMTKQMQRNLLAMPVIQDTHATCPTTVLHDTHSSIPLFPV